MDYLAKITGFYKKNRRMPNYTEIMSLVGFKSRDSVSKLVKKLERQGFLSRDHKGFLIPKKLYGEVKVLGYVEAGFPSPAEEELVDTMTLDEWLIRNKEATFMLKVKGDSMIDAGIMEGDMVLLERGKEAKSGDIVVAEVDGAWTMKYLEKKGGKVRLLPANKNYKPIEPKEELKVAAVVTAVIRKYH
jgi:repressor LexA